MDRFTSPSAQKPVSALVLFNFTRMEKLEFNAAHKNHRHSGHGINTTHIVSVLAQGKTLRSSLSLFMGGRIGFPFRLLFNSSGALIKGEAALSL